MVVERVSPEVNEYDDNGEGRVNAEASILLGRAPVPEARLDNVGEEEEAAVTEGDRLATDEEQEEETGEIDRSKRFSISD